MKRFGKITASIAVVFCMLMGSLAYAGITSKVYKSFKKEIVISAGQLPKNAGTETETIKTFQKLRLKQIAHKKSDGQKTWSFHYTAFMTKKSPVATLSFDFYKKKDYVASKRIVIDTSTKIIAGFMNMTEDDGVEANNNYTLKLVAEVNNREITLAQTTITLK